MKLNLKAALQELNEKLQANADAMAVLIDEREDLFYQPAPAIDIEKRLNVILDQEEKSFLDSSVMKLGRLASGPDAPGHSPISFLQEQFHRGEGYQQTVNVGALVYFLRPQFNDKVKQLAKHLEKEDAGLPQVERQVRIAKIDKEIERLEIEREELLQTAREAGLTIGEEYVVDPVAQTTGQTKKSDSQSDTRQPAEFPQRTSDAVRRPRLDQPSADDFQ